MRNLSIGFHSGKPPQTFILSSLMCQWIFMAFSKRVALIAGLDVNVALPAKLALPDKNHFWL